MMNRAPIFFLKINGERLPKELIQRCNYFEYEGIADKMNVVHLKFENTDLSLLDNPLLDPEQENILTFQFGYIDGKMTKPKDYVIRASEGVKKLHIRAYQQKPSMATQSRNQVYEQVKWSDVAIQVAKRNFLAYQVEDTKTVFEQIAQSNESDNKFIKQGAEKIGFEFFVENGVLHFHSKDFGLKPVKEYKYYPNDNERTKSDMKDIRPKAQSTGKPPQVSKKGFDPYEKKGYEVNSNKDNVKRTTAGEGTYLYSLNTGDEKYIPGKVESSEHPKEAQAKSESDGEFKKTEENVIEADGDFIGHPEVLEKQLITISNLGQKYSGIYRVKRCSHIIAGSSSEAYSMQLKLTKNAYNKGGQPTGAKVNKKKADKEDQPQKAKMYVYNQETGEETVEYI